MARPPAGRAPARPGTDRQAARRSNVLDVAAQLGEELPFEQVQMADVAKRAGVALGTLYRYFPSKTQLFVALFYEEIDRFLAEWAPDPHRGGVDNVAAQFVELTHLLLSRPRLAAAMVQCSTAGYATASVTEVALQLTPLRSAVLRLLGVNAPTSEHHTRVRLLQYVWWGVLVSIIDGKTAPDVGDDEIRLGTALILGQDRPA